MGARLTSGAQPLGAECGHGTEPALMASPEGGRHKCWWSGVPARSGPPRPAWHTRGLHPAWLHASEASGQSPASEASGDCIHPAWLSSGLHPAWLHASEASGQSPASEASGNTIAYVCARASPARTRGDILLNTGLEVPISNKNQCNRVTHLLMRELASEYIAISLE